MIVRVLLFRDWLRAFYGKYSRYIDPALRALTAFLAFFMLGRSLGYMSVLRHPGVEALLAVICGLLSWGSVSFFAMIILLGHLWALSTEVFLTVAVIFLVMFCAYYVFQPGNSIIVVLLPLLYMFHIPYVIPICVGLMMGPFGAIPVGLGVMISYIIRFVQTNASSLRDPSSLPVLQRYTQLILYLKDAKAMWLLIAVFCAVVIVVWAVRRLSIQYAWLIAILAGGVLSVAGILGGIFALDITSLPVGWVIAGTLISIVLALILEFFFFLLDYTRTEYAQFEDDTYYYYVKAVPKYAVAQTDVTVTQIAGRKKSRPEEDREEPARAAAPVPEAKAFEADVFEGRTMDLQKARDAVKDQTSRLDQTLRLDQTPRPDQTARPDQPAVSSEEAPVDLAPEEEEILSQGLEERIEAALEEMFVESVSGSRELGTSAHEASREETADKT